MAFPSTVNDSTNSDKLNRVVSIRISESEYEELNKLSRGSGARSIADVARHSIQQTLSKTATDTNQSIALYMYLLHQEVQSLRSELKVCVRTVQTLTEAVKLVSPQKKMRTANRPHPTNP